MYNWLYSLLDRDKISKGEDIWILSYTTAQGENLIGESDKYAKVKGRNPKEDFNFIQSCYAGMPINSLPTPKVACYDEIDVGLSAKFSKNISKDIPYRLGMTGTNTARANVYTDVVGELEGMRQSDIATEKGEITDFINKGQLLEILCPVVYEYTREQGLKEGLASPFNTKVIHHMLDKGKKNLQIWKSYPDTLGSEYDFYTKKIARTKSFRVPRFVKGLVAKECCSFLWNLPSKVKIVKNLLDELEGQTIIFGWNLPLLCQITDNVVMSKSTTNFTVNSVYYSTKKNKKKELTYHKKCMKSFRMKKITKEEYDKVRLFWKENIYKENLLEQFKAGKISNIASSKAIGRGVSPGVVNNIIVPSYSSKSANMEQWLGRSRYAEGKTTNVYFIRTLGTYEDKWFEELQNIYDYKGDMERTLDLGKISQISSLNYLK